MKTITEYFSGMDINFDTFWKAALLLLLGTLIMSIFGRFVFGKRSILNNAISSAISILFIYLLTIIVKSAGAEFQNLVAPLPFVNISHSEITLFSFTGAHYTAICTEILSMIILSFLVNLADGWLPKGKNIFTWLFFRCLTIAIGYALHLIIVGLLATYLPHAIITYAPVILLIILILLLLTGALKILVGAALTMVNPIIGALYTFFFANIIGKQVTKAVLTTALLTALVIILQYIGLGVISIASAALIAYIPFLLILIVLWYVIFRVF